jgi:hypothetical protein
VMWHLSLLQPCVKNAQTLTVKGDDEEVV